MLFTRKCRPRGYEGKAAERQANTTRKSNDRVGPLASELEQVKEDNTEGVDFSNGPYYEPIKKAAHKMEQMI